MTAVLHDAVRVVSPTALANLLCYACRPCYSPLQCHIMLEKGGLEGRPVPAAAASVSQPGLLLPTHASHSKGRDKADVVEFPVAMGPTRRATLTPLTVRAYETIASSTLRSI